MKLKAIFIYLLSLIITVLFVIISIIFAYQLIANKKAFQKHIDKINYSTKAATIIEDELKDYVREEIVTSLEVKTIVTDSTDIIINKLFNKKEKIDKQEINNYINAWIKVKLKDYFDNQNIEINDEAINETSKTLTKPIYDNLFPINEFSLLESKINTLDNYLIYINIIIIVLIFLSIFMVWLLDKNFFTNLLKIFLGTSFLLIILIGVVTIKDFYYMNSHTALLLNNLINHFVINIWICVSILLIFTISLLILQKKQKNVEKYN